MKIKNNIQKYRDFIIYRPILINSISIILNLVISWARRGFIIAVISVGFQFISAILLYQVICSIKKINVHPMMKKSEILKHEQDRVLVMAISIIIAIAMAQIFACNKEVYYALKRIYVL